MVPASVTAWSLMGRTQIGDSKHGIHASDWQPHQMLEMLPLSHNAYVNFQIEEKDSCARM